MHNQMELKKQIGKNWDLFREHMPDITHGYDELTQAAYAGGKVDAKTKRLMAIVVAVVCGCRGCMLYQTGHALDLGADSNEILETCAVAVSLGGTMAAAETTRVVQYLREVGALDPK